MPNYCYCGRSEMQPFCDGSHNVVPARKPDAAEHPLPPSPAPSAESPRKPATPRAGLLQRLFGRT